MAKVKGQIVIDTERCKGCEICIGTCNEHTIVMSKKVNHKGYHFIETANDDCTGCTNCAIICPDGVITVYRMKMPSSLLENTSLK